MFRGAKVRSFQTTGGVSQKNCAPFVWLLWGAKDSMISDFKKLQRSGLNLAFEILYELI